MTYGYYSNKRGRKQSRSKTKQLELRRILASLTMAAGILASPFSVGEAAIVDKGGNTINPEGKVYNITPEGTKDNFAYKRYQQFALDSGYIANLKFGSGTNDAATLANLVQQKIEINGIVNAVKNGKIDGHLIFLSPQGIAVGSTGVINAGQFTGIVPTKDDFDKLYNANNSDASATITQKAVEDIQKGAYATGGTINISGHINTHSGVMLGAGIININDGARIQSTKNLDFKDLVNIQNGASANLGTLTKVEGSGGDIILSAKQVSDVKDTKTVQDTNNQETTEAHAIRWSERSTDLSAAVNIGKDATTKGVQITSSAGAVKLTAESTSTYKDSTPMTLTGTMKTAIFGSEETAFDGLLDKLAAGEAGANKYLLFNYSNKKNKSAVNIGTNSTITGNSIDVAANSKVEIKQSVTVPELPIGEDKKDSNGNVIPSGSKVLSTVTVSRVDNKADIVVDGNLKATGADEAGSGIKIAANADTKVELAAGGNGGDANAVAVGVAVLAGDTKANVVVNDKVTENAQPGENDLSATAGKVSVEATTGSDIDVNVVAKGTQSYVVSNVGVANYDTNADVTMNRNITAGAVDIKAENKITGLKLTVDNTVNPLVALLTSKDTAKLNDTQQTEDNNAAAGEQNSGQKSINPTKVMGDASVDTINDEKTKDAAGSDGKGGIQDVMDKVTGTNVGEDNAQQTSAFGLGASVGVLSNKNDANVTVGKNVVITATPVEGSKTVDGSVMVAANTLMTASKEKEDSFQLSVKNTQANAKTKIGAAVLVSNLKNNATVLLDSDGTNAAQIKGGAVSVNANAGMGKYKDGTEDKTSTLSYAAGAENKATEDQHATFALSGSVGINTLKNNAIVMLGQKSKVEGSAVTLSSDAATSAAGTYGAADNNSSVGIGGTVGLQNIRGNSLVMAGKGVQLTGNGDESSVKASANNSMDLKNNVQNAGKGDLIGISGMVVLSYGESNSIVSLDDEAVINAPEVSVESENSTNVDNSARSESEGNESSKAFGIGVGIVNYDVNSVAMVSDNGAISAINKPDDNALDKDKAAWKINADTLLARRVAGDTLAGKLGTATAANAEKSVITTSDLSVSATTTGMLKNDAKAKAVSSTATDNTEDPNTRSDSQTWTQWSNQGTTGANEARTNTENLEQDNVNSQNGDAAPSASGTGQNEGSAPAAEGTTENNDAAPNASGAGREASSAANPDETPTNGGSAPAAGSEGSAGASIGIEGSVALTFLGGRTDAVLDNVTVKSGTDPDNLVDSISVSVDATDFLGSVTLGGTNIKHSLKESSSATKVGIGGTFAMNSTNRDVDSFVRNSNIEKAGFLSNSATKIGIEVAAGMGVSASKGDGTNVNGAGVVYYNRAKQDVHALMINNTVTSDFLGNVLGLGMLSNVATSTDFQIAGGLAANSGSGSNTNVGLGGAVAISNLENDLSSGIIGGSYTNFSSIDVEAQKGTTQINGAAAGGKSGYGFNGAFAYGSVKNTTHAYISDATVGGILTGEVNVKAGEVPVVKTKETLDKETTELANEQTKVDGKTTLTANAKTRMKGALQKDSDESKKNAAQTAKNKIILEGDTTTQETGIGVDTTGKVYLLEGDETSSIDVKDTEGNAVDNTDGGKIADEAASDENDAKGLLGQNHSLTITAAMAGGLVSDVGVGAGIAYNYVKNDIAADIKGSTITADAVNGEASSDSLIVSVGAGVAVGGKAFNGAGSGSWNDLKNDTKVTFANNTIQTNKISEEADNSSSIINIAGEVAGGKGMAMGLSLAYNSLNNTTGTYLTGNDIDMEDLLKGGENSVKLSTVNTGKALAVAGGVDVNFSQSFAGAVGTVAINRGVNNTESVIDGKTDGTKTTLDDLKTLSVTAEELTKKTTVAGGVSVGGKKVGIGGAVAYSAIGSSGNKEKLRAEVNNADITTTADGKITVSTTDSKTTKNNTTNEVTTDKSRITTVGAGIGVGWGKNWFNLQGAAAVSDIYKDNRAYLNNTSINAKEGYVGYHPTIDVMADTKSKINTVGAVGNISITGKVTGTVGLAINRMDQDTKAEMATDNGNTTTVNAGLTQVRATGDGDIHSVGVGATVSVGEYVTAAGSGSYNYIGNDVNAIIQNQNITSDSSVGVVAQSDDRLYNFAGGFNIGANTRAALGTAVSTNKITGSTNALMSGGSVSATDSGAVKVSRPKDGAIFTAAKLNVSTTRDDLISSREGNDKEKTGIVVDSSATHTLISQLSSGGVAASSTVGVSLAGTVNINTIEGNTTAKIQDANLNSAQNASNINVNAVDYTNFGSVTGTPAVGVGAAAGVSLGVSANWETYGRTTEAEISSTSADAKKSVYANDLTVDAIAKHGSSGLSFAAAAAGAKIGVASGDNIMRHKNTSTVSAKLDKVNAVFNGTAEIKADHLGNSHTENVAASLAAGMVAVAVGAGVSVMDDTSKVTAEVANSELKAKESTDGKNISVLANNENNWKNLLVTASLGAGIGAGVAANVGIYNTTGETAALVTNSNLAAYDVNVNATDKMTAHGTGGVGGGGVGGVGVAVTLNNINSSVSSHVTGGTVTAAHDINVKAEEERSFNSQVTGAAAGGIGVGVNVAVTSINKGITNAQLSNAKDENNNPTGVNADTQNQIKKHLDSVNAAKGALGATDDKFTGIFGLKDKSDLKTARDMSVDLSTPDTKKMGVHTSVGGGAKLEASNDVNVTAKDTSDIFAKNIGVTAAGAASINVTDAIIHTNYDTDVTLDQATIAGKNVTINALQTQAAPKDGKQGSDVRVTAVTVGALASVGVGYAGIVNRGATDVNITDSNIKSTENVNVENVTIEAKDESKHQSQILSVGVAALNVTTTFASVENYSNVGVTLGGKNDISATGNVAIDAKKANALEAHTQGVGVGGVNVAVNHATIEDGGKDGDRVTGNVTAKITGTNGTFTANSFHLGATNDTTAKLSAGSTAVSVLGVSRMRGKGVMNMGADVSVAGGHFNANTVEFASTLGNANGRTLEGNVKGHNISAVAVAPDVVALTTEAAGTVNVANSTFGENTNLILDNESYVDRKAYIYSVTAGAVAVGNTSADIYGKETLNTSLTGKVNTSNKLASLQVGTYGENKGKAFADAGGGSLVGYIGAHVRNDSINNVTSTLGGKWETTGDVWLVAAQKDETRLTASEGHGGIAGVGGTSVDNYIDTTTEAKVENNTEITADRTHIGTGNAITTGAYDDTNEKGATDAQTFTMKDHFGGVISGNRLRSLIDVKENGTVTIGDKAKITTNHLQEYIAASENNLTNLVEAKGGGAIAVTDAVSEFILDIHNNVNVGSGAILSNEKAASTEDITLAAYDNLTMKSQVDGTVYAGVISPIVTKNIVVTDRTSDVTVAGTIESGSNVGLYAGADEKGTLSNLKADLKSGAYNYSVISITTPRVKYNKNDDDKDIGKDKGTVNVSGMVRSTKDINVIASSGKERISKDQSLWNWALGGSSTNKTFLTSDAVTADEALPKTSTVNVTGSLIAGTAYPINVTIGGSVADGLTITADDNDANNRVKAGITQGTFDYANTLGARLTELNNLIAAYDGENVNNGGPDVMAAYIAERTRIKEEMEKLGLTETDSSGKKVYSNTGRPVYYVEIPDMATSGGNINVTSNDFIGGGTLEAYSAPSITITNDSDAYLKLNNIIMGEKGGQIIYNTIDNVIPPNVSQGNAKINSLNVSKKNGASFSKIYGPTDGETASNLTVNNTRTFIRDDDKTSTITVTDDMKEQMRQEVVNAANIELSAEGLTAEERRKIEENRDNLLSEISGYESFTYTAITDVEVNGKISNFHGNVTINNNSGDIRISGGTQARPTGVSGNTVTLTAAKGTIAQGYTEGIVNIDGNPEMYLNSYTSYTDNQLITDAEKNMEFEYINVWKGTLLENILPPNMVWVRKSGSNRSGNATTTYTRPASSQEATGYIAGRDVYVSASNINVNGLIQSGYKNYTATVTETQLEAAKERPASRAVVVQNRTMYKVNDGGAKWSSGDNAFYYEAQVYWDPSTDKLVVEDIDTQGGKIYLTGKIAGTGNGRILAADGAAIITVTNKTALDMNVGKVLNNQREGIITIADTAKDTWTEYRRGQTRIISKDEQGSIGYASYLKKYAQEAANQEAGDLYNHPEVKVQTNNGLTVGSTLTYNPKEKQTYNWTKGKTVDTTQTFLHHKRYGLWGAVETKDATELRGEAKVIKEAPNKEYGLPEGAVIRQWKEGDPDDYVVTGNTLRLDTTSNLLSSWRSEPERWMEKTGFLGWFRNYYTRWDEGQKTLKTYNYSISASEPIAIGLIGDATGSINIASTNANGGSINLTGNVANSHNAAPLTVNSVAGGIFQNDNTTLKSEIVNLSAKNDISNIHIASIGEVTGKDAEGKAIVTDNIRLNAVSTGKGDIDITAVGGFLNNQSLPGNVTIVALKSQDGNNAFSSNAALGDVTLTANGNITQYGTGTTVEGRGITLTSKNGGIGTAKNDGIGTAGQAIQIAGSDLVYSTDRYGAQVNASAKDSIYLTEATAGGDMRVGKIESREGDVNLTVLDGGFIDALPKEDKSGSNDSVDEMVHRWIDAGLIAPDANYKGAYITGLEKKRDDYAADVTAAYDTTKGGKTQAQWQADYNEYKASYDSYIANRDKYANYDSLSQEERETLDKDNPGGYENYKRFSAQKAAYDSYLANKERFDNLSQSERETLEKNGDSDYKAYKYYSQFGNVTADEYLKTNTVSYKYSQYADAEAYLKADAKYKDLVDKADPEKRTFEWTKEMMLYAVSDKMVNPEGGGSVQTEQAANVLGVNVKLNAAKGVGTFADESETITGEQLTGSDAVTYMKKLLNVGASDVKVEKTVNEDGATRVKSFTITRNMPLGVFLKEKDSQESGTQETGALNVQAGGDVFVAGRTETVGQDVHSAINVGAIDAKSGDKTYDVRLHSAKGIYNAKTVNDTNITGRNLILTGGEESIGEADKPLTVSLTGDMTEARANKNVFIKNMNDADFLRLGAMSAGDTISLNSHKGFLMSSANSDIAVSYINAGKTLQFVADETTGIVGNADHAIRILNDRAPVDITAGTAYIKGVGNTDIRNGTLLLGTINTTGEFTATSDGSLSVGREEEKDGAGNVVKEAVEGSINAGDKGGNVTLVSTDNLTLDGAVKAGNLTDAKRTLTLKADNGDITQTAKGAITADAVNTFNGKSLLLETANNQFNSITVDGIETETGKAIAGNVRIKDKSDALTVAVKRDVTGDISVENLGALTNSGNLTATGNIGLKADGNLTQAEGTTLTAGKDVNLTSSHAGISQNTTAGIHAQKVTTVSARDVDLQGTGNQFGAITVQSADANAPIQGHVLVQDSADKLALSIQSVVNGDIKVENKEANGTLQAVTDLEAKGNGTENSGDITLKSKGTMQTTGKLTAAEDVNLTSTSGDVTIGGDVTTGTQEPKFEDLNNDGIPEVQEPYNALVIHAGGAIQEAEGVKIATPVVETYSAKGVSMESKNNTFEFFLADALGDNTIINGSVKAVTSYAGGEDQTFTAGVGASVVGDVEFTNLHQDGHLGLLMLHPERDISVLEGNGAKGDLVLKASQDVGLLGDAYAAHDVVAKSTNGSFYGIGRSITAENDVNVSVADSVYYIGGTGKALSARHDIIFEATNPASKDAGIYIGALPDNINLMDVMNGTASVEEAPTKLWAGNNANFNVNGNGDIDLKGDVMARDGEVAATISGKGDITVGTEEGDAKTTIMAQKDVTLETKDGDIKVTKGIQSTEESVSVQTGKGDITVGRDNVVDGKTITAKKDVSVGTDLGTIYIQGETSTVNGDITMRAGKDTYEVESDNVNFVIRDDGKVSSGGGVTLKGRNGDIHITNDISAKKGLTASITEQGNVYFDTDVDVTENVDISTDKGNINVGHTVNAKTGTVSLQTGTGDISIGADVTAGSDVTMHVNNGDVTVGDGVTGDDAGSSGQGNVVAKNGDVTVDISGKGNVGITKSVDSQNGSVSVKTKDGDINIGSANVKDDKTVTAKENVNVETDLGTIYILGMTSTEKGDITMKAGKDTYLPDTGSDENLVQNGNFIIKDDGKLNAGGAVNLKGRNGDIHITDAIEAQKGITTSITEKGNVYFEKDVTVKDDVNITTEDGNIAIGKTVTSTEGNVNLQTGTGSILIGEDVTAEKDVTITTKEGSVIVGDTDTGGDGDVLSKKGDVSIQTGEGVVGIVKSVKAQEGSIDIQVGTGGVTIGNNGPKEKTVTAYKNIDVAVELGRIEIYGKTSTQTGDISMSAAESTYVPGGQNIIIAQYGELDSGRDARLTGRNGDLHVTDAVKAVRNLNATVLDEGDISLDRDVNVIGNTTVTINGKGSVFGHNIVSGGTTHVALTNGDLFLNLAEGKAVVLRMENNTAASRVNTVKADASGGAGLDVELTGNFIQIGTVEAKGGNSVLQLSAIGAGNQKLISGEISVGSLRSGNGTHMPSLWANRGNVHVDEGNLAIDDVLAKDKIHLENNLTDMAIFGRTPTRDGEQLYYWNNLSRAYDKQRSFQLYTDGKVRTRRAVLIDAGRYYDKLYGDNLSVVDMMRERLTHLHGRFAFDSALLTKRGEFLREKVLFGLDAVDTDIRKHNASNGELL